MLMAPLWHRSRPQHSDPPKGYGANNRESGIEGITITTNSKISKHSVSASVDLAENNIKILRLLFVVLFVVPAGARLNPFEP